MLKRAIWRRVEKVNYAASVVGITLDGLPGQGSLAMAFAQSLPFLTPSAGLRRDARELRIEARGNPKAPVQLRQSQSRD